MSYVRYSRKTQVIWQGGHAGALLAEKAHRVEDLTIYTPEVIEAIAAEVAMGQYYPGEPLAGGRYAEVGFGCEVRGRHTVDEPPPEGSLMRAAAFGETSTGTTPNIVWAYLLGDPHPSDGAPAGKTEALATMRFNYDRRAYTMQNLVASAFEMDWSPGKPAMYRFKFRGQVASVSATVSGYSETAPIVAFDAGNRGVPVRNEAFTITGYTGTPRVLQITFKLNPEFDEREDLNSTLGGYGIPLITGYDPRLIVRLEEDLRTNHDPFSQFIAATALTAGWQHNPGGALGQKLVGAFIGKLASSPKVSAVKGKLVAELDLCQATGSALPSFSWT